MLSGTERKGIKTFHLMALGTIGRTPVPGHLALVKIVVAIAAPRKLQRAGHAGLVACVACDAPVPAFKRKRSAVVIKIVHPFDLGKGQLTVALRTRGTKPSLVRIGMTISAVVVADTPESLELQIIQQAHLMAGGACHLTVFPGQRETGAVVIEPRGGFEGVGVVAVGTIGRKCLLVVIGVAGQTIGSQPQERRHFLSGFGIAHPFRFMTIGAFLRGMGSLQRVARKFMVELVAVEADDLKAEPVVVAVAGCTLLPPDSG